MRSYELNKSVVNRSRSRNNNRSRRNSNNRTKIRSRNNNRSSSRRNNINRNNRTKIRRNSNNKSDYIAKIRYIVSKKFPDDKYKIEIQTYNNNISTFINDKNNDDCLTFTFHVIDKNIHIDGIASCLDTKGTYILNSMKYIGKQLNAHKLSLVDASTIENSNDCDIELSIYKILINGESWYNKYGFKSIYHDKEKIEWDNIRNRSFFETFLKFKDKIVNSEIKTNLYDNKIKALIDKINKWRPKLETSPRKYTGLRKRYNRTLETIKGMVDKLKTMSKVEYDTQITNDILTKYTKLQQNILFILGIFNIRLSNTVRYVFNKLEKIRINEDYSKLSLKISKKQFNCILNKLILIFSNSIYYNRKLIYIIK